MKTVTKMPDEYASLLAREEAFGRIEEHFNKDLDVSLDPRGPDMLYNLVADLGVPAGSTALDIGCGNGRHTIELVMRFGLNLVGIDPVGLNIEIAAQSASAAELIDGGNSAAVRFAMGTAEMLPVLDASVDFVWCQDVLELVDHLSMAYTEIRRVLRPSGKALIYQMFATDRLEPREAAAAIGMGRGESVPGLRRRQDASSGAPNRRVYRDRYGVGRV
jgi:ubiquinone/menaquinone biosynthesis C-methylase UbiE